MSLTISKIKVQKIKCKRWIFKPKFSRWLNVSLFPIPVNCISDFRFPGWGAGTSIFSLREISRSARMRDSEPSIHQAAMPGLSGWITPERRILASTSARSIRNLRSCMQCSSLYEVIVVPLHISCFTFAPCTTIYDSNSIFFCFYRNRNFFINFYENNWIFWFAY